MRRSLLLALPLLMVTPLLNAQANFKFTSYSVSAASSGVTSGDFNRDGKPDMAVLSGESDTDSFVTVFLATTAGHFPTTGTSYAVHSSPADIRTADINNDGKLDLIISFVNQPVLSILFGNGDGTFTPGPDVAVTYPIATHGFDIGDFNHDGNIDFGVIECDTTPVCDVRAYLGNGAGAFTAGYKIQMTAAAQSLSARDMNGDGNLDFILVRTTDVLIFGGDGTGRFPEFIHYTVPKHCTDSSVCTDSLDSVVVADFNNDGNLDFAVLQGHNCGSACGSNDVYVYKGDGNYPFTMVTDLPIGPSAGGNLLAADLNGDGNYDLVNANGSSFGSGNVYAQGAGNFSFTIQSNNIPSPAAQLIARDMNLDSRHDVLATIWMDNDVEVGLNTSGYTNCKPPSSANIAAKICAPAASASVTSPVLVTASGNSPAGIVRLEVWVDGVKKYQKWNDQLNKRISIASGSHRLTVVAVDMYEGTSKTSVTIDVQ
jgi:hypothetical protein